MWLTTKKRGRDDDKIKEGRSKALADRKARRLNTSKSPSPLQKKQQKKELRKPQPNTRDKNSSAKPKRKGAVGSGSHNTGNLSESDESSSVSFSLSLSPSSSEEDEGKKYFHIPKLSKISKRTRNNKQSGQRQPQQKDKKVVKKLGVKSASASLVNESTCPSSSSEEFGEFLENHRSKSKKGLGTDVSEISSASNRNVLKGKNPVLFSKKFGSSCDSLSSKSHDVDNNNNQLVATGELRPPSKLNQPPKKRREPLFARTNRAQQSSSKVGLSTSSEGESEDDETYDDGELGSKENLSLAKLPHAEQNLHRQQQAQQQKWVKNHKNDNSQDVNISNKKDDTVDCLSVEGRKQQQHLSSSEVKTGHKGKRTKNVLPNDGTLDVGDDEIKIKGPMSSQNALKTGQQEQDGECHFNEDYTHDCKNIYYEISSIQGVNENKGMVDLCTKQEEAQKQNETKRGVENIATISSEENSQTVGIDNKTEMPKEMGDLQDAEEPTKSEFASKVAASRDEIKHTGDRHSTNIGQKVNEVEPKSSIRISEESLHIDEHRRDSAESPQKIDIHASAETDDEEAGLIVDEVSDTLDAPPSLTQMINDEAASIDPSTSEQDEVRKRTVNNMMQMRRTMEVYVKQKYNNLLCLQNTYGDSDIHQAAPRKTEPNLYNMINQLDNSREIPKSFIDAMHELRNLGNIATHGDPSRLPERSFLENVVKRYLAERKQFESTYTTRQRQQHCDDNRHSYEQKRVGSTNATATATATSSRQGRQGRQGRQRGYDCRNEKDKCKGTTSVIVPQHQDHYYGQSTDGRQEHSHYRHNSDQVQANDNNGGIPRWRRREDPRFRQHTDDRSGSSSTNGVQRYNRNRCMADVESGRRNDTRRGREDYSRQTRNAQSDRRYHNTRDYRDSSRRR